jgi:addiction module HigA family antidote
MHSPPHPGALVREDVIKELGLTVTAAADMLSMSRTNLSLFLNERIDLSPEMALKLEAAFGLEAEMLMGMQTDHNMAKARKRQAEITAKVRRAEPVPG